MTGEFVALGFDPGLATTGYGIVQAVGRAVRTTVHREGVATGNVRYFIASRFLSGARFAQAVRGHWGIENRLHWVRDVTFDEDRCQIRTGAAPQVMAALRNLVIGLFRLSGLRNIAAALRTHAWHAQRAIALVTTPQGITQ